METDLDAARSETDGAMHPRTKPQVSWDFPLLLLPT